MIETKRNGMLMQEDRKPKRTLASCSCNGWLCVSSNSSADLPIAGTEGTGTGADTGDGSSSLGVAVGLGVALAFVLIVFVVAMVVAVVWLRRHDWTLPCAGRQAWRRRRPHLVQCPQMPG